MNKLALRNDKPGAILAAGRFLKACRPTLAHLKSLAGPVCTDDVLGTIGNQIRDWHYRGRVELVDIEEAVRRLTTAEQLGKLVYPRDFVAAFARHVGQARRDRLDDEERARMAEYCRAKPETEEEREGRRQALAILRDWMKGTHLPEGGTRGDPEGEAGGRPTTGPEEEAARGEGDGGAGGPEEEAEEPAGQEEAEG